MGSRYRFPLDASWFEMLDALERGTQVLGHFRMLCDDVVFLERIGIFTVKSYLTKWRVAILVIFVLAMLLTPADPISMLMMAVPLTILYFGGVALCHWMPKSRSPFQLPDEI